MYQFKSYITLSETDATGVIFFPKILEKCVSVFEHFLKNQGLFLNEFFDKGFYFPVVNAEMNVKRPLKVGDEVLIEMRVKNQGETSMTLEYLFFTLKKEKIADVLITHVLVDKNTRSKAPLNSEIKALFQSLKS